MQTDRQVVRRYWKDRGSLVLRWQAWRVGDILHPAYEARDENIRGLQSRWLSNDEGEEVEKVLEVEKTATEPPIVLLTPKPGALGCIRSINSLIVVDHVGQQCAYNLTSN